MQKKTSDKSEARKPSPVTWEFFTWFLQTLRQDIEETLSLLPAQSKKRGRWRAWLRNAQQFQPAQVQEAWLQLETDENRRRAVWLLSKAKVDAQMDIWSDPRLRRVRRKQDKTLPSLHQRVEQAGEEFLASLEAYRKAIRIIPFVKLTASLPTSREEEKLFKEVDEWWRKYKEWPEMQVSWIKEVEKTSDEVRGFLDRQQQIGDYEVDPPAQKPGRQEKSGLNQAIRELEQMLKRGLSRKRAQELVHALLYAAGAWPNSDPDSFPAKVSQLSQGSPL